ncbi:MAG: hypothetical protein AAF500_16820 [Myxococcota bacterium]
MTRAITIDARFNGPPDSGNGGYVCGVIASQIEGPAVVTLRTPPPLDRRLTLESTGQSVVLRDGATVVGHAASEPLELDVPAAPSFEQAMAARERFPARERHAFPTCFVCGPGRPGHDGMEIFPGPVDADGTVASAWLPDDSMPNHEGRIRDEIAWAALDCTSYFPHYPTLALLGRMHAQVFEAPRTGERYVVAGWSIGQEGRKHWSGSAMFDRSGKLLAMARATWIELRQGVEGA